MIKINTGALKIMLIIIIIIIIVWLSKSFTTHVTILAFKCKYCYMCLIVVMGDTLIHLPINRYFRYRYGIEIELLEGAVSIL